MKMYSWKDIEKELDEIPKLRKKDAIKRLTLAARFLSEKIKVFYGRQENELGKSGNDEGEDPRSGVS